MIIDMHSHFVPQALLDHAATRRAFRSVKTTMDKGGLCMSFAGAKPTRPVMPLMSDVGKRCEWLTAQRIDKQVAGGTAANLFHIETRVEAR